jgi:hypothetical protein
VSRNVYSDQLAASPTDGPVDVGWFVPAGVVWVVRDMTYFPNAQLFGGTIARWTVLAGGIFGPVIWSVLQGCIVEKNTYHWTGHCVLPSGTDLFLIKGDVSDSFTASGYVLTLP